MCNGGLWKSSLYTNNMVYTINSNHTSYFLLHLRSICDLPSHNIGYMIFTIHTLFVEDPNAPTEEIHTSLCYGKTTAVHFV